MNSCFEALINIDKKATHIKYYCQCEEDKKICSNQKFSCSEVTYNRVDIVAACIHKKEEYIQTKEKQHYAECP